MSYNIDSVEVLPGSNAKISKVDVIAIHAATEKARIAEINFVEDYMEFFLKNPSETEVVINKFHWYGSFSGSSYEYLLNEILPKIQGKLELIFVWEGGDSFTGIRVEEGKVYEHEVEFKLGAIKTDDDDDDD